MKIWNIHFLIENRTEKLKKNPKLKKNINKYKKKSIIIGLMIKNLII
jgi:hypothetical protein